MAAGVPQQLRIGDRKIANRQLASTQAALFGALPLEAVIAPLRGDKQREQEPTNDAVPVAGRDRILVSHLSQPFILPLVIRILFA
jgi:hypothetical protein